MKKTMFILATVALGLSLPVHAKDSYEAGKTKSATCVACHGVNGVSVVPSFPKLAGQERDYLYHAMKDYKSGKRDNAVMAEQLKDMSDADLLDLALYFSKQKGLILKY